MTDGDRTLLERAARAAGYEIARWTDDGTALLLVGVQRPWNSLHPNPHSDCMGDALRLAVRLGLVLNLSPREDCRGQTVVTYWGVCKIEEPGDESREVAACRAITRAAAAMAGEDGNV